MTDKLREAAQMALEALELVDGYVMGKHEAKEALYEALAQPEQEPPCKTGSQCVGNKCERCAVQPEREWQGLTDEERQECLYSDPIFGMAASTFARAIEAKLKEKNGAT